MLAPAIEVGANPMGIRLDAFEYIFANVCRERFGGQALYNDATIPADGLPAYQFRYVHQYVVDYLDGPRVAVRIG